MTTTPFDQALMRARQLPPRERARLVAVLVEELAEPAAAPVADDTPTDVLAELDQLIAETGDPLPIDSAVQLSMERR